MIVHHSFAFPRRFMINLMLISFAFPLFLFSGSSLLIENHGGGLSPSADFFFMGPNHQTHEWYTNHMMAKGFNWELKMLLLLSRSREVVRWLGCALSLLTSRQPTAKKGT